MTYKKMMNPLFLFGISYGLYLAIFFLFEVGAIKSFLIVNRSFPKIGLAHLLLYIILEFMLMFVFVQIKSPKLRAGFKVPFPSHTLLFIVILLSLASIYGLYFGALRNFPISIFHLNFWKLTMSNVFRRSLVWGKGYTMMTNLSLVGLTISSLLIKRHVLYRILMWVNFATLFVSAFAYSARLKIVIAIIIVFAPHIRFEKFDSKLNRPLVLFITLVIIIFLIWGGGVRGANTIAKHWTESPLLWSLYGFTDYFVSTTLFSIYGLSESPENIKDIWTIRAQLGPQEIHGYTNSGRYFSIYSTFGFLGFFFVFFKTWFVAKAWKSFSVGRPFGIMVYPLVIYFILEGLRIEPLLIPDFYIPLAILVALALLFGNEIRPNNSSERI